MSVAVKTCGLSTEEAVAAAVAGGAKYLGFVFYPPSPRSVTAERAAELCRAVPKGVAKVGLFVDADDLLLAQVLNRVPLDLLQFHGKESPERVADVKRRFGRPVMKAVHVAVAEDLAAVEGYKDVADWILFDAKPPKTATALPGGNGLAFDWSILGGRSWPFHWMLSGGLTAENLEEAVIATGATVVDVSSGIESRPGVKDVTKIAAFLAAAQRVG